MCKVIIALFGALIAGGMAWVMQGAGIDATVSTWAICGALVGLFGSIVIGA